MYIYTHTYIYVYITYYIYVYISTMEYRRAEKDVTAPRVEIFREATMEVGFIMFHLFFWELSSGN